MAIFTGGHFLFAMNALKFFNMGGHFFGHSEFMASEGANKILHSYTLFIGRDKVYKKKSKIRMNRLANLG